MIEHAEGPDRGLRIALGILGGLVVLGAVLIVQAERPSPAHPPAAVLTSGDLPSPAIAEPAASAPSITVPPSGVTQASKAPPVWRVSAMEQDSSVEVVRGTLGKHNLVGALGQAGIAKAEVRRVAHVIDGVRRLEHGAPKDTFVVARDRAKGTVAAFELVASPTEIWQAKSDEAGTFTLKKLELAIERKRTQAAIVVSSDLPKAIAAAGLREEAIEEIDDALEGHGDAAVIKRGVRLRIVGTEEWVEGVFARYRVDAVEYVPKGGAPLRVYFYERDGGAGGSRRSTPHPGYYDAKGQQPFKGAFRSPVPLARVTSRFNPKRMHPVLHVVTPHNGIDFGASTGTPVFAASSGTVQSAGDSGPCGNMVQIDHGNGLTTAYCHLSRFASGLRVGQRVDARQLVGFVGQTGRVTGPHLHFAVKRGGTFIDPMGLKMDGVRTLPPSDREAFAKRRAELDPALEAVTLPPADGSAPVDDKDEEPAGEE